MGVEEKVRKREKSEETGNEDEECVKEYVKKSLKTEKL